MRCDAARLRSVIAACAVALAGLTGCASAPITAPIDAPRLVVGDHWQYHVTDNLRRGAKSQLDVEVIAVAGDAAKVRFGYADDSGISEWIDEVDNKGGLRSGLLGRETPRPFDPPAQMLAFPLEPGKTWRQVINTFRRDLELNDQILIYGRVQGWQPSAPGGYGGVYVYRIVQLDDEEFWRTRTTRRDAVWYAAEAKAPVRETRDAEYTEIGGPDVATVRTESRVFELVSFVPGGK